MAEGDSIRLKARLTGLFWLGTIVTGIAAELLANKVLVAGSPARTAALMAAGQGSLRLAIVANLLTNACYLGVTVLLYDLMRPVSRTLARLGVACGSLGLALGLVGVLAQIAQLSLVTAKWTSGIPTEQVQTLSYAAFALRTWVFPIGMSFFGAQMASTGWLITRSTYLPRWIGWMLAVGGTVYVVGSLVILLGPSLQSVMFPVMMVTALLGEGTLTAWLLAKGVDRERWEVMAAGAR